MLTYNGTARNIALAVKTKKDVCLYYQIAKVLSDSVHEGDIIIPAPNHGGKAAYTKEIAILVSLMTGANVEDCLTRTPRDPIYQSGIIREKTEKEREIEMFLTKKPNGNLYFLDNVIDTGATFETARRLLPGIRPLIYATTGRYVGADETR